jgi:hypothetical protein
MPLITPHERDMLTKLMISIATIDFLLVKKQRFLIKVPLISKCSDAYKAAAAESAYSYCTVNTLKIHGNLTSEQLH